jgi:hypothetical protein
VLVLATVFNGVALMFLWGWFVVIPFGLPALSIGQALGVSTLVSFMTYQYVDCKEDDSKTSGERMALMVAGALLRPLFALAFGRLIFFLTYGQ